MSSHEPDPVDSPSDLSLKNASPSSSARDPASSTGQEASNPSIATSSRDVETPVAQTGGRRRWIRRAVSLWLLFHVAGIIVAPASVSPTSGLMQSTWRIFRPYLQVFYLNHGYHFFAPEPGASTLVGYTLEFPDGSTETGRIPNRQIHPRLMYHRHFMLTEFLGFVPDDEEQPWHRSYARHLCHTYGAERVSLSRISHDLPTPAAVVEGRTLQDPEGYSEVPLGSFVCEDL